jgi:ribonuclease Z
MSKLSRRLTMVVAAVAILAATGWWMIHIPAVQDAIFRRVIAHTLEATRNDLLEPDSLRVVLCGTGNPLPDRARAAACTAIFAGGNIYLVDIGPGAWKNLALWRIPGAKLAAIMLTFIPITSATSAKSTSRRGLMDGTIRCACMDQWASIKW